MRNSFLSGGVKNILRHLIADAYYWLGFHKISNKGNVVILMYHRVLNDNDDTINYIQPGMYVTTSSFDKHMKYISENYRVISLNQLMEEWKKNSLNYHDKYCVVTFDDGWLDNYENAFPIIKKYQIPATIFLATSFIDNDSWFWPDKVGYIIYIQERQKLMKALNEVNFVDSSLLAVKKEFITLLENNADMDNIELIDKTIEGLKQYSDNDIHRVVDAALSFLNKKLSLRRITLNWNEVKEMSKKGITFGSHTCNHKLLTQLSSDDILKELVDSKTMLTNKGINCESVFCYPNGNYNDEVQDLAKRCGYEAAVTTIYGHEKTAWQKNYNMKRIGIHNDICSSVPLFAFHLSGLVRSVKNYV